MKTHKDRVKEVKRDANKFFTIFSNQQKRCLFFSYAKKKGHLNAGYCLKKDCVTLSENVSKEDDLKSMGALIGLAYRKGLNLDDKTTLFGEKWDILMKYFYSIGMGFRWNILCMGCPELHAPISTKKMTIDEYNNHIHSKEEFDAIVKEMKDKHELLSDYP